MNNTLQRLKLFMLVT